MDICHILYSLNIGVDDLKWGHPNLQVSKCGRDGGKYIVFHNGEPICIDPNWKKGHKVRVRVADFRNIGFRLEMKKKLLDKLFDPNQKPASKCPNRKYSIRSDKIKHQDEAHHSLPQELRKHIIHYTHVCMCLGCPYSPKKILSEKLSSNEK